MSIKHKKNLTVQGNGDPNEVQPDDWNEAHDVDGLLGALDNVGVGADRLPYLDANAAGALAPLTAFMRTLLGTASLSALMAALGAVSKAGDTMGGALVMSGNKVTGLGAPTVAADAATKAYVDALASVVSGALVFKGAWDASSGEFPADDGIKTGWFYKVEVAGTVGGVDFDQGDEIFAVADDPSATVYAANWLRIEGTITAAEIEAVLGFAFGSAASKDVGTEAGNVVQLDGTGKLPALDASQLTNIPGGFSGAYGDLSGKPTLFSGQYADLSGKPTLGTAAAKDAGTGAGNVLLLSTANKLPALDGSLLTNVPTTIPSYAAVGSYAFLARNGTIVAGNNYSGLNISGINDLGSGRCNIVLDAVVSGTWQAQGSSSAGGGSTYAVSLFKRVA